MALTESVDRKELEGLLSELEHKKRGFSKQSKGKIKSAKRQLNALLHGWGMKTNH